MKLKRQTFIEESDHLSPYDPDEEPEDLWFLPDAEEEEGHLLPGGMQAVPRGLIDAPTGARSKARWRPTSRTWLSMSADWLNVCRWLGRGRCSGWPRPRQRV